MMDSLSFKKLSAVAFMFGFIGISSGAMAGSKFVQDVVINDTLILGNFADARNSEDSVQRIETYDYGSFMYIFGSQYNVSHGCSTDDATVMTQLRAANSDATLLAEISNGTCINVFVMNSSEFAPKKH